MARYGGGGPTDDVMDDDEFAQIQAKILKKKGSQ